MTTQFEKDLQVNISVNGKPMPRGIYNLLVSKRDLGLFCKGIKPHRNWRLSPVKEYFGIKGNKQEVYKELCDMVEAVLPSKKENA